MVDRSALVAAVDGKALRSPKQFVLSIFVNDLRQMVWQSDVDGKANELSTMERALAGHTFSQ